MSVNEIITDRIIKLIEEKNELPWSKPWKCSNKQLSLNTGNEYHGINALMTWMQGYDCPYWATFRQIQEKGGRVKKGSKGTPIIFFTKQEGKEDENENKTYPVMRYYTVFNLDQTEGIAIPDANRERAENFNPIEQAENIVKGYIGRPEIQEGGRDAAYAPELDQVFMPFKNTFREESSYYSVLFHELSHSTGHKNRLNRFEGAESTNFGSEVYSKEELIAELSAAFLCNEAGIVQQVIENSAAYIQNWSKALRSNPNWIISAAARAQKAFDWIMGQRPGMDPGKAKPNQEAQAEPVAIPEPIAPAIQAVPTSEQCLSTWKFKGLTFRLLDCGGRYFLDDSTGRCEVKACESYPLDLAAIEKKLRASLREQYGDHKPALPNYRKIQGAWWAGWRPAYVGDSKY